tara:strand:- start:47 stop:1486 length:1440 start_codon:yes stop_codon:yes gene_type:complete
MSVLEKSRYEAIQSYCEGAKEHAETIPSYSIITARCAVESILEAYLIDYNRTNPSKPKSTIEEYLVQIRKNPNIEDLSERTHTLITSIQGFGNTAAHKDAYTLKAEDAQAVVQMLTELELWYNDLPEPENHPTQHDEPKRKELMSTGFRLVRLGKLEQAAIYFDQASLASEDQTSKKATIARMRALECRLNLYGGSSTKKLLNEELQNAAKHGGASGFYLAHLLHRAHIQDGERLAAIHILTEAEKWLEDEKKTGDWTDEIGRGLVSLISLHVWDGNKEKAQHYHQKLLQLSNEYNTSQLQFDLYLSQIRLNSGPEESTNPYQDLNTLELMKTTIQDIQFPKPNIATCMEFEYLLRGKIGVNEDIIALGKEAYDTYKSLGYMVDYAFGYNNLAVDYLEMQDYEQARSHLEEADKLCNELLLKDLKPFIEVNMGKLYALLGDNVAAAHHFDLASKLGAKRLGKEDIIRFKKDRQEYLGGN